MANGAKNEPMNEIRQHIQTVMTDKENISPKAISLIEETLIKMQEESLTVKEALNFSSEIIEEFYEYGYHLFQSGKFKEALLVFTLLQQLDGGNPNFTFAIAATHHQMKNYPEATGNYILYATLDQTNPIPYYHMYDCFTKMNQSLLALDALKQAGRLAERAPQYAELKGKIELELKHLNSLESHFK